MHAAKVILPLLLMGLRGLAQTSPPELTLDIHPPTRGHTLQMEATYHHLKWHTGDTLQFLLREGQVQSVRLLEGRLKNPLPFRHRDSTLYIWPGEAVLSRSGVAIRYRYPLEEVARRRIQVHLDSVSWAVNWLNGGPESGLGLAGIFYPVPRQQAALTMHFNVTLPQEWPLKIGQARAQFVVDQPGWRSHFWQSEGRLAPRDFFLAAGAWTAPDAEDREELLARQAEQMRERRVAAFRARHQDLLRYLGQQAPRLLTTETGMAVLKGALPRDSAFYLRRREWPLEPAQVDEQRKLALRWFAPDTARAARALFHFGVKKYGAAWRDSLLQDRFVNNALEGSFWWEQYLQTYLAREGLSWADTGQTDLSAHQQAVLALATRVRQRQRALPLRLSYRYQAQEGRFYIYLQSDSARRPFRVQLEIHLQGQDSLVQQSFLAWWGQPDTVAIPWRESPRNAYTTAHPWAPLHWQEERPLNWYLYEFSRSADEERRAQALAYLLRTAKGNLLSTVIGIALDTGIPRQQRLALEQAHRMQAAGRAKLKPTFEKLARESPHRDIRLKAQEWLQAHFP